MILTEMFNRIKVTYTVYVMRDMCLMTDTEGTWNKDRANTDSHVATTNISTAATAEVLQELAGLM